MFSLSGKVIVVTGASGLLGREHVDAISAFGGIPILIDLNQEVLDSQVEELNNKYNLNSSGFAVDITNEAQVKNISSVILKNYGKIDCLVNNAANNPKVEGKADINFSRLEYFPVDVWQSDLDVSLKGSFLCIKYFGLLISKNVNGGAIVNISSDLGLIAPDQRLYRIDGVAEEKQPVKPVTYSVVKTGLIGLTRYVATYWAEKNVRCNVICPGGIDNGQNAVFLNEVVKRIPLNRLAKKSEYRGVLVFLLSDAASYLNGSVIAADGGRTAW